jgi:hypothetical protein
VQTAASLEPEHVAAAIAPIIDRLRLAVVGGLRPTTLEIAERTGLPVPVLMPLGLLRNAMPDRTVAIDDILELFVYQPPDQVRAAIDGLVAGNLLESVSPDEVRLTDGGMVVIGSLFGRTQAFLDDLWSGHAERVATLLPLAQRACAAVIDSGGGATRVMAPQYEPVGASPFLLLGETLSPLRFHRHDAHAAAWRAAGLTVQQIQQLEPGAQRDGIEAETNRRAAPPYAVLSADERFTLLAGLGALPN